MLKLCIQRTRQRARIHYLSNVGAGPCQPMRNVDLHRAKSCRAIVWSRRNPFIIRTFRRARSIRKKRDARSRDRILHGASQCRRRAQSTAHETLWRWSRQQSMVQFDAVAPTPTILPPTAIQFAIELWKELVESWDASAFEMEELRRAQCLEAV